MGLVLTGPKKKKKGSAGIGSRQELSYVCEIDCWSSKSCLFRRQQNGEPAKNGGKIALSASSYLQILRPAYRAQRGLKQVTFDGKQNEIKPNSVLPILLTLPYIVFSFSIALITF